MSNYAQRVLGRGIDYYPLYVFGFLAAVVVLIVWLVRRRSEITVPARLQFTAQRILPLAACALGASYLCIVSYYLSTPTYFDHCEIGVAARAYLLQAGHALYHSLEAPQRYNMAYAGTMALSGPSFFSCKLLSAGCAVAFFATTLCCFRRHLSAKEALVGAAFVMLLVLSHAWQSFQVKPDPMINLCVAIGLWACIAPRPVIAVPLLALALGASADLKIHAVLYFVYPLLLLSQRTGCRPVLGALAGAGAVAAIPFLHPNISCYNWMQVLLIQSRHGLGAGEIEWTLHWLIYLLLPIFALLAWRRYLRGTDSPQWITLAEWMQCVALGGSLLAVGLIASKVGAGPAHLVPFAPLVCYATIQLSRSCQHRPSPEALARRRVVKGFTAVYVGTALLLAVYQECRMVSILRFRTPISRAVNADLEVIMALFPGNTLSMGYGLGEHSWISDHRLPLVFAGRPYVLDSAALMDYEAAGLALPRSTRDMFLRRQIDIWLVPKTEPPFSFRNAYPPHRPLFDRQFREAFLQNYECRSQSEYFDLYFAGSQASGASRVAQSELRGLTRNQVTGAIAHYRKALRLQPDLRIALNNLAWLLATAGDTGLRSGPEAVTLAERAVAIDGRTPQSLDTLAAAYAEAGRFDRALVTAEEAVLLADAAGQKDQASEFRARALLYRMRQPYREP